VFIVFSYACRGVILYAMVCGRLPFGDDNQIKKTQSRVLYFNRNISSGMIEFYYKLASDVASYCITMMHVYLQSHL